jgi:hypothetical protein
LNQQQRPPRLFSAKALKFAANSIPARFKRDGTIAAFLGRAPAVCGPIHIILGWAEVGPLPGVAGILGGWK